MKKRLLSFVLTGVLVFALAIGVLPIRAGAVLPVGFVESAFASYAMSSGYTFFSEEMDDPLFLGLFRELYDDFVTVKSALGQTIRRWDEYDNRDVYLDRSGNIVVSYGVAQDWAGAMEWIQSHYEIEEGGEEVTVVSPVSGGLSNSDGTATAKKYQFSTPIVINNKTYYRSEFIACTYIYNNYNWPMYLISDTTDVFYVSLYDNGSDILVNFAGVSGSSIGFTYGQNHDRVLTNYQFDNYKFKPLWLSKSSYRISDIGLDLSLVNLDGSFVNSLIETGTIAGLAVSIGSAVTDVAQGMTDEDAIVIGVGAVPGISEGEIADFIADGIRADTLEPTATITATDVIDTPVQPYPDIDGLGLPSLGAALTSRFPFCIPWDFVDTVQLLAADPVAPDFSFDLLPQRIRDYCHITASTEVRFNMGDPKFSKVGVFCRWGSLISFCFGLAVLTKRMIWTA